MISIKLEDHTKEVKGEWKNRKKEIMYAIGLKWQKICTEIITNKKIVDTGRLRASLTFITVDKVGKSLKPTKYNKPSDYLNGSSGSDIEIIVGSNVEYAKKQELTNRKGNFLAPSILEYRDVYRDLAQQLMEK